MQKLLRIVAVAAFVPLLGVCGLALKIVLTVIGLLSSLVGWELAWPPVERVDVEDLGLETAGDVSGSHHGHR